MMKTLVFLAVLLTVTVARSQDGSCFTGMDCGDDVECKCSENEGLLCDSNYRCNTPTFWEIMVLRRKPCFRMYKDPCVSNDDCPCDGRLICEDGECVEKRNPRVVSRRY